MSLTPITELLVPYDSGPLTEKVARRRALVRSRMISLLITVAVLAGVYLWQRDQLRGAGFLIAYGIVLAVPLVWLIVVSIMYLRARGALRGVREGVAIRMGPPGIQVAELAAPWSQVSSVAAVKPGVGKGPVLRLSLVDGRQSAVPFEQVTVFPASLDSAVRAFSASRHGVDLSALDN